MNTGIQRSSATPAGAWTTTTPMGAVKQEAKKDIVKIMLAHSVPYVATASVAYPDDVVYKFKKARRIAGSRFIHLLSPCPPGWRIDSSKSIQVTRMATQAKIFPIYEIENGQATINIQPGRNISVGEYFRAQGRFAEMPADMIARAQKNTDRKWQELEQMSNQDSTSVADGKRFGNIG
jgi:pyruvate/2-oxoacid:ferredoxin oxidoreductase beta subunit